MAFSKVIEYKTVLSRLSNLVLARRYCSHKGLPNFDHTADETLESLCERIEELVDSNSQLADADVTLASGVLTFSLPPPHGTYVINKQTPNKQIWLSSPQSGPYRFDLTPNEWVYRHTKESLHSLLNREVGDILQVKDFKSFSSCYFAKDQ